MLSPLNNDILGHNIGIDNTTIVIHTSVKDIYRVSQCTFGIKIMQRSYSDRRNLLKKIGAAGGIGVGVTLAGCTDEVDDNDASGVGDDDDGPDAEEDTLVATQPIWPESIDPHLHNSSNTYDMINYTAYEPLLHREEATDEDGNYTQSTVPALATDWEFVDDDETVVRFHLREGVTFHNGDELTKEDVVYTYERAYDEDESPIGAPRITNLPQYDGIEAVEDEFAVDLYLTNASPLTTRRLAGGVVIVNRDVAESDDVDLTQEPIGTGPYELEETVDGEYLEYAYYEDYWGEEPDFERLRWDVVPETQAQVSSVLADETDLAVEINPQGLEQINNDDVGHTELTPTDRSVFMQMRNVGDDDPPFQSPEFREAMALAIDNQNITENVVGQYGEPTATLAEDFTPESGDLDPYPHDPERAEELVEESGFAGTEFALHTPQGRYLRDTEVAQAVVNDINQLSNVSAEVNIRDSNSWIDQLTSDDAAEQPEASIVGWGGNDFLVKTAVVQCSLVEGSWGGNCYEELEELIDEANEIEEYDPYLEVAQEISQWLHDEYVNIWLYNPFNLYGLSDRVEYDPPIDEGVYPWEVERA